MLTVQEVVQRYFPANLTISMRAQLLAVATVQCCAALSMV